MSRNPGYIVETKTGKAGRTFHNKELVNGKVPVYLATEFKEYDNKRGGILKVASKYSDQAVLCEQTTLRVLGMID